MQQLLFTIDYPCIFPFSVSAMRAPRGMVTCYSGTLSTFKYNIVDSYLILLSIELQLAAQKASVYHMSLIIWK